MPDIFGDRDRLHQVFLNLIQNAVEASPSGGTIGIHTRVLGSWQDREPRTDSAKTTFEIEVVDEGPGFSEEAQANLMTPFFTTKKNGNGLGLPLCYQIVHAHNGYLRYQQARGGSASLIVGLPMEPRDR